MKQRRGFALMAALWLVVLVGVTGYGLSVQSRSRRLAVANSLEYTAADAAADGAMETVRGFLQNRLLHPLDSRSRFLADTTLDPWSDIASASQDTLQLGEARATASLYDAGARLHLNHATEAELRRMLTALPMDAAAADRLAQRIMDWRDADDLPRGRGAERDAYLRAGARVLPSNADFATVEELRSVDGVTPELFSRIVRHVTVLGSGRVNINTASAPVLYSLPGVSDEAVGVVLREQQQGRAIHSLEELTKRLSSGARAALVDAAVDLIPRLAFESTEIVVNADGWVTGSPVHAREEALFVRGGEAMFTVWRRSVR